MAAAVAAEGVEEQEDAAIAPEAPEGAEEPEEPRCAFIRPEVFMRAMEARVVSQEALRPKLAAAFSRYTAYAAGRHEVGRPVPLIYGPSGAGKSYAVELCADLCGLPVTVLGGPGVSPAGYKGTTLRDLMTQHYMLSRGNPHGVVFIDEVDKWCRGAMAQGGQRVDGEAVQNGLSKQFEALRYVEHERIVFVDEGKDIEELEHQEMNTGDLMFIFGGAFTGLDRIITHRTGQEQMRSEEIWEHADPQDFIQYGLVLEFAYRVTEYGWVKRLTAPEIKRVLELQDRRRWESLFDLIGCELDLQEGALAAAATLADQQNTGPRGARVWFNRTMDDVFVMADEHQLSRVTVDAAVMHTGHLDLSHAV